MILLYGQDMIYILFIMLLSYQLVTLEQRGSLLDQATAIFTESANFRRTIIAIQYKPHLVVQSVCFALINSMLQLMKWAVITR
jgi:hypothetical protein